MTDEEKKIVRLYAQGDRGYKKDINMLYKKYLGKDDQSIEWQYISEIFSPVPDILLKIELRRMMGADNRDQ